MIITATVFVIFITVFVMVGFKLSKKQFSKSINFHLQISDDATLVQGTTTKPVVKLLGIRLETEEDVILFEVTTNRVIQFTTRAMEDITGLRSTNTWLEKFHTFSEHYLMSVLVRDKRGISSVEVVDAYEEVGGWSLDERCSYRFRMQLCQSSLTINLT